VVAQARNYIGTSPYYATSLAQLSTLLLRSKKPGEADEVINQSIKLAEDHARQPVVGLSDSYSYELSLTLCDIAGLLAGTDLEERGRNLLLRAADLGESVTGVKEKATVTARLAYAFARFGDTGRANELATELFTTQKSWRGFGGYTVLIQLSECLTILRDKEKLLEALRISQFDAPQFGPDYGSQVDVIVGLARIGDYEKALEEGTKIQGTAEHVQALVQVAMAMPDAEFERAVGLVRAAVRGARLHGRASLIGVLGVGASVLARIDQGRTLWRICEAVTQVDSWWKAI
jgi:hypothetical protein